jgi:4-amino-4-deoxy-L-arabinose transferase-like glycosyltransferase
MEQNREQSAAFAGQTGAFLRSAGVFALLLAFSVVVRLPDLSMPLERDEGEYAYAAQEILEGRMPYTDSFCQKPPIVFFWYLTGFFLFGETVEGIHLVACLAAALAGLGVYLLCLRLPGGAFARPAAWLAALAFCLASAGYGYFGPAANTEIFMAVPVLFGAVAVVEAAERGRRVAWFLAGFFFAAAFLTKQVALFSFIGPALFASSILWRRRSPVGEHVKPLLFGGMGALAVAGPIAGWLALKGAFGACLEASFGYNLSYVGSPFGAWKWNALFDLLCDRFAFTDGVLWLCAAVCFALPLFSRSARRSGACWFVLLWFAGSLFGVALGPKTMGHYFLQILPPLVLAAGFLSREAACLAGPRRAGAWAIFGLVAVGVLLPPAIGRAGTLALTVNERSDALYSVYGDPPFAAALEVGALLRKTTGVDDRILVVGSEPEILFYADRRSATRFTIFYPLSGTYDGADAMCDELLAEIEAVKPLKVVCARSGVFFLTGRESPESRARIDRRMERLLFRIRNFLVEGYDEEYRVYPPRGGDVLVLPPGSAPPSGEQPLFHLFTRKTPSR